MQRFTEIVQAPGFMDELKKAIKLLDAKESKVLLANLMPLLRLGGATVPFGPVQQSLAVSKLCSMLFYFGLPAWFITVSPSDIDSTLILRLSNPLNDNTDPLHLDFVIPHMDVGLETLARNPVAAAEGIWSSDNSNIRKSRSSTIKPWF